MGQQHIFPDSARALENYFVSYLPERSRCSLSFPFSSPFLCPPTLSQVHLLSPFFIFSSCPSPSHPLSESNFPCFSPLFTFQRANGGSGACLAGCDFTPLLRFPPAEAEPFRLSAALQRLPQQGAASALASQTSAGYGRAREGGERPLEGEKCVIPAAVSHFEGHSREALPPLCLPTWSCHWSRKAKASE